MADEKQRHEEEVRRQQDEQRRALEDQQKAQGQQGQTAVVRGAVAQPGGEATQKVRIRTRTGQNRMRAGLSIPTDYQEYEVTEAQLTQLESDDQLQILKEGEDPSKGGGKEPINVMHAAYDPALAALHPDKLREIQQRGGGQLPQLAAQATPAVTNPNLAPAGPQLPPGAQDVHRGAKRNP